jgi:DNA-binding MarR family transcriptional regulator
MNDMQRYETALDRVFELAALLGRDFDRGVARDGLTAARAQVLWELQQRGPMTQRDLAEELRVSPRNVTGLVDGLVATGFVTREPHPADRRATLVTFTRRGAKIAQAMRREHAELAGRLFGGMPARQFGSFAKGLDEIVDRLRLARK